MKETINPFKVGDILHWQYAYCGTHPEFFVVTKCTPQGVYIRSLPSVAVECTDGYGQEGFRMPTDPSSILKEDYKGRFHRIVRGTVKVDTYGHAGKWDGKKKPFGSA